MKIKRTLRGTYEEVSEPYTFLLLKEDLFDEAAAAARDIPNYYLRAEYGINPVTHGLIAWVSPGRGASYRWYKYDRGVWTEFSP